MDDVRTFADRLLKGEPCACRWEPGQSKLEPPTLTECAYHGGMRQQIEGLVAETTQLRTRIASKY
jgi:hypothetical protein